MLSYRIPLQFEFAKFLSWSGDNGLLLGKENIQDAYEDAYEEGEEELEDREDSRDSYLSEAYDSGYSRGEGDRYRGLSRNPYRHEDAERGSPRFTRAWRDGYEDGWNDN